MIKLHARDMLPKRKAPCPISDGKVAQRPLKRRRTTKRVEFAEASNEYFPSDETNADYNSTWYSKAEIKAMEQAAIADARTLKSQEKHTTNPDSWSRSLFRVHRALQRAQSPQQVAAVLAQPLAGLDERIVGLEGVIVSPITKDFVARRQHILAKLEWLQSNNQNLLLMDHEQVSDESRANNIAQAVAMESRVARLYAHVLAQAAWQEAMTS